MKSLRFSVVFIFAICGLHLHGEQPDIPVLDWTPRADWINVMDHGAIGDGVADDTAAIQAALNLINDRGGDSPDDVAGPSSPRIVYFPPGTYRISATLELRHVQGPSLIGHGRASILSWHGAAAANMLWQSGITNGWYNGLAFDGRGLAANGIHMASLSYFETGLRLENLSFRGFTNAALDLNHPFSEDIGGQANADSMINNCLFVGNEIGIRLGSSNVFAWIIEGCEFRENGIGIATNFGNFYAKNSHFAFSRVSDIVIDVNGPTSSVTRCTSFGSRRFVWDRGAIFPDVNATQIRDCRVAAWTDPAGAVQIVGGQTIVDTIFTDPPSPNPPIRVIDSGRNTGNSILIGGNQSAHTTALVADETRGDLRIITIPPGQLSPNDLTSTTRFLKSTASGDSPVIFDARANFGAVGDGVADDTVAIQATINAARDAGNGAVAYLPLGNYRITNPLVATGGNYRIEGSSLSARLIWGGGGNTELLRVVNPRDILLRSFDVRVNNQLEAMVRVTSTSADSRVEFDRVFTHDFSGLQQRGLRFDSLAPGTQAHVRHAYGAMDLINCERAHIFVTYHSAITPIRVAGAGAIRDGSLFVSVAESFIRIEDNQNFVAEDLYIENGAHGIIARGSLNNPPGRFSIASAGVLWVGHTLNNYAGRTWPRERIIFDGYHGSAYLGGHWAYNANTVSTGVIQATGDSPLDLVLSGDIGFLADGATWDDFEFQVSPSVRLTKLGRFSVRQWRSYSLPDEIAPGGLQALAASWDDIRRLGRRDLELNHLGRQALPHETPAPHPGPAAGIYRLRAANSTGDGLYLTQPGYWDETLALQPPTGGDPYEPLGAVFQYAHLEPADNGRWSVWINRQDANGIFRAGLRANGDNASVTTGSTTTWSLLDAGDGTWHLEMPNGRRLTAPDLSANATVQTITGPDAANQRWLLEPVTLAPSPVLNFNAALDAVERGVLTWFHDVGLTKEFQIQRRPEGSETWTTVGLVWAANINRSNGRWVEPLSSELAGPKEYRLISVNPYGSSTSETRTITYPAEVPPTPPPSGQENLIPNPSFEDGAAPWGYINASRVDEVSYDGSFAARITGPNGGIWQTVTDLTPNTTYRLSVWAAVSEPGQTVYLYAKNFAHDALDVELSNFSSSSYSRHEVTFTTGPNSTTAEIGVWKTEGSGHAMVDDFRLELVPPPNLLPNPGFEDGDLPWQRWNSTRIEGDAASGSYASRIDGPDGGVWQTVSGLEPSTTYRLTVQAKVSEPGQTIFLYAKDFDATGTTLQSANFSGSIYATYSLEFTTGPNATSAEIGVWKSAGGGHALVDDFALVELSTAASSSATTLAAWHEGHFTEAQRSDPTISENNASPAGDGMPNLLKYYLGLDPWEPAPPEALPFASLNTPAADVLTLAYSRARYTPDAAGVIEWSETLAPDSWSADGVTVEVVEQTDTREYIEANVPTEGRERLFLRLRVTPTP